MAMMAMTTSNSIRVKPEHSFLKPRIIFSRHPLLLVRCLTLPKQAMFCRHAIAVSTPSTASNSRTTSTRLPAVIEPEPDEEGNGSVTADYNVIGVRPSSGAASTGCSDASDSIGARSRSHIAAPEDGRTPPRRSPAVADPVPNRDESPSRAIELESLIGLALRQFGLNASSNKWLNARFQRC